MKKINIIYGTLLIVFVMMCCSCGARKVQKDHYKEEIKSEVKDNSVIEKQSETNVKTTNTTITDDKNESVTEETIYKPEDSSKEAYIIEKDGTKTVLNNASKTIRKVSKKNNAQTQTASNTTEVKKEAVKEQKAIKQVNTYKKENSSKAIDKKQFNVVPLVLVISFIVIALWFIYRKYKNLPFVPKI